jgi:hypothetical protein
LLCRREFVSFCGLPLRDILEEMWLPQGAAGAKNAAHLTFIFSFPEQLLALHDKAVNQ